MGDIKIVVYNTPIESFDKNDNQKKWCILINEAIIKTNKFSRFNLDINRKLIDTIFIFIYALTFCLELDSSLKNYQFLQILVF
jgi:hypothetical protein